MPRYFHLYDNGLIESTEELIETDTNQFIDAHRLTLKGQEVSILVCNIDTFYRATVLAVAFDLIPIVFPHRSKPRVARKAYQGTELLRLAQCIKDAKAWKITSTAINHEN